MGFTRFASTACSHKVHSWGAAVRGHWFSSEVTNWHSLCSCRSHTSAATAARSCTPSNPAVRGGHPPRAPPFVSFLYVLAQRVCQNYVDFFPKKSALRTCIRWFSHLLTISWDLSFFKKVEPFMMHKSVISTYGKKIAVFKGISAST